MSKLQELREFVKQQFEQADPTDKNAIDRGRWNRN